jgi:hypothetical protein
VTSELFGEIIRYGFCDKATIKPTQLNSIEIKGIRPGRSAVALDVAGLTTG